MSSMTHPADHGARTRLGRAWSGRRRWPLVSARGGAVAAALVLLPLGFLVVQAQQSAGARSHALLLRHSVGELLWNTVRLTLACTAAVRGARRRRRLAASSAPTCPLRRAVGGRCSCCRSPCRTSSSSYGWVSIAPGLHGYLAARDDHDAVATTRSSTCRSRPCCAASTRRSRRRARASGSGPWRTFLRVTLPQIGPPCSAAACSSTLDLLAEFGAFAMLRFQTFTTAIYTEYKLGFDGPAAAMLALGRARAALPGAARRRAGAARARALRARRLRRRRAPAAPRCASAARQLPALLALAALVGARARRAARARSSTGSLHGSSTTLPRPRSSPRSRDTTAASWRRGGALTTLLALPVALARRPPPQPR